MAVNRTAAISESIKPKTGTEDRSAGTSLSDALMAGQQALDAYNAYNAFKHGDTMGGAAGALRTAGNLFENHTLGGLGSALSAISSARKGDYLGAGLRGVNAYNALSGSHLGTIGETDYLGPAMSTYMTIRGIQDAHTAEKEMGQQQAAGAELGGAIGSFWPGAGNLIGTGVGWLAGTLAESMGRRLTAPWKAVSTGARQRQRVYDLQQSQGETFQNGLKGTPPSTVHDVSNWREAMKKDARNDPANAENVAKEQALLNKAVQATPPGFVGYWTDPETNTPVWVNKPMEDFYAANGGYDQDNGPDQDDPEFLKRLGAGDVLNAPWFYENIKGWGDMSLDKRIAIAEHFLKTGTQHGNAGDIDFEMGAADQQFVNDTIGGTGQDMQAYIDSMNANAEAARNQNAQLAAQARAENAANARRSSLLGLANQATSMTGNLTSRYVSQLMPGQKPSGLQGGSGVDISGILSSIAG